MELRPGREGFRTFSGSGREGEDFVGILTGFSTSGIVLFPEGKTDLPCFPPAPEGSRVRSRKKGMGLSPILPENPDRKSGSGELSSLSRPHGQSEETISRPDRSASGKIRGPSRGAGAVGKLLLALALFLSLFHGLPVSWALPPAHPGDRKQKLLFRSDQSLLNVAGEDYRRQHDRMAKRALRELLASHPLSLLRGPALLLFARISAREVLEGKVRDFHAPIALFRKAEEATPTGWDQGEVRFRMGQYLIRRRFGVEGRGLLEQVLSKYPDGPWSYRSKLLMADSLRQEGSYLGAEQILKRIDPEISDLVSVLPPSRKESLEFYYGYGHLLMDEGRMKEAGNLFLRALRISSPYPYRHSGILFLLGRYAYSLRHDRRAVRLFRTYMRFYPDDPRSAEAEYSLARISGRMGNHSHERARLREVIRNNPGTTGSHLAQIRLIRLTFFPVPPTPVPLPEAWKNATDRLARIDTEEKSVRIAERAALLRVQLFVREGKDDEAMRAIGRLRGKADPASSFIRKLRVEERKVLVNKLIRLSDPLHPSLLLAFYHSYRYRLPKRSEPGGGDLSLLLARARWKKGEWQKAFSDLDRAMANPFDRKAGRKAASMKFSWLVTRGKTRSALDFGDRMLSDPSLSPKEKGLWFARTVDLSKKIGDERRERTLLRRWIVSGSPPDPSGPSLARLGLLDISAGREKRGESELEQALPSIRNDPGKKGILAGVTFRLGQLAWSRGEKERAADYWKEMRSCCPGDPRGAWAMYQMGNLSLERGDRKGALAWYGKVVKEFGKTETGKLVRQKIEMLELEKNGGKQ